MAAKERTKENCRCFDAADPRLGGCTPPRPPIRKSEGPQATRTQYYCSRLTPVGLPPLLSRGLRGCERGATVERSETGERAMFAPAGQTTARAGQLCWLAVLVMRRQAPRTPAGVNSSVVGAAYMPPATYRGNPSTGKGEGCRPPLPLSSTSRLRQSVGAGHARPSTLLLPPRILCIVGRGLDPSAGRWGRRPPTAANHRASHNRPAPPNKNNLPATSRRQVIFVF